MINTIKYKIVKIELKWINAFIIFALLYGRRLLLNVTNYF